MAQGAHEAWEPDEGGPGTESEDLVGDEGERAEVGVFTVDATVVEELKCGPAVVGLPEQVWDGDEDEQGDAVGGLAGEEEASLRGKEQACAEGEEEKGHGRFVEEADAGGDAEDGPPGPWVFAFRELNESEKAGKPEGGFPAVHGKVAVLPEVHGGEEDGEHGE